MLVACVLVDCKLGKEEGVIETLEHLDSVKEVHGTIGKYDIIAKVDHVKKEKLQEIIVWNMQKTDYIRSTLKGMERQN